MTTVQYELLIIRIAYSLYIILDHFLVCLIDEFVLSLFLSQFLVVFSVLIILLGIIQISEHDFLAFNQLINTILFVLSLFLYLKVYITLP